MNLQFLKFETLPTVKKKNRKTTFLSSEEVFKFWNPFISGQIIGDFKKPF